MSRRAACSIGEAPARLEGLPGRGPPRVKGWPLAADATAMDAQRPTPLGRSGRSVRIVAYVFLLAVGLLASVGAWTGGQIWRLGLVASIAVAHDRLRRYLVPEWVSRRARRAWVDMERLSAEAPAAGRRVGLAGEAFRAQEKRLWRIAADALPPPPGDDLRRATAARWALVALVAGGAWLLAGGLALAWLVGYYPPLPAQMFVAIGAPATVALVEFVGDRVKGARRGVVGLQATALALLLPPLAIWSIPGLGRLPTTPLPGRPTFAVVALPDGSPDLYLIGDGGQTITRLTQWGTLVGTADLSPDGQRIAFSDRRYGTADLFVMDLDQDGRPVAVHRLTRGDADEVAPRWSPDGHRIAFEDVFVQRSDVAVIDADGGPPTRLTDDGHSWQPSWSPDGRTIVYSGYGQHGGPDADVWMMKADGSDARRVARTAGNDSGAFLSPDATSVAFTSDASGDDDVWLGDVDTGAVTALTPGSRSNDSAVGWSRDARYVFLLSDRSRTGGTFMYFMRTTGGEATLAVVL